MIKTDKSVRYFEENKPKYSLHAYSLIIKYLKNHPSGRILEVGSGNGESLIYLSKNVSSEVFGLEPARAYQAKISKKIPNRVYNFSILDSGELKKIDKKFDSIVICRVLHHLVARSPSASMALSQKAIDNCFSLLKKNGQLIILEPVFAPRIFNQLLFYIKKFFSKITHRRIMIFNYWNNIGEPVVNYFTKNSLLNLVKTHELKNVEVINNKNNLIHRAFQRREVLVVVRK